MNAGQFQSQLEFQKNNLVSLYKKKTKEIAARESKRFEYLTVLKAKYTAVISAMIGLVFNQFESRAYQLLLMIVGVIQEQIPMTNLNGEGIERFGPNPQDYGGGVGFLSPIENIISKPFLAYGPENTRTALEIYGAESYQIIDPFLQNLNPVGPEGIALSFDIPPSPAWVELVAQGRSVELNGELATIYPVVAQALTNKFSIGSYKDVLAEMHEALNYIIEKTVFIVNLQTQINAAELAFAEFVQGYKEYAGNRSVEEMLKELQSASENAEVMPPVGTDEMLPLSAAPSKFPWMIAGAAVGIFLLTKGKK